MAYDGSARPFTISADQLPEAFEDEAAFCLWIRETFQADLDADRLNRDAHLEDMEFFAGDQWRQEDLDARKGRPCLTINTLPQYVAQVVGDIRINRPSIRIRPAEDDDQEEADLREGLIRQIERESDAQAVYAAAGQNQTVGGQGSFEVTLDYADPRSFNRVIGIKAIPNPLSVVWDRMSLESTGRDAGHVFVTDKMTPRAFKKEYPGQLPSDLQPEMRQSDWCSDDSIRVSRLCLMKETQVEIALLDDGTVIDVDKLASDQVAVRRRNSIRRSCVTYITNGHKILAEPVEWPIDRVPVIKVTGWETWVGDNRLRWGLVRFARDPQKLKNYWRSVSAETLALAPKAQWLMPMRGENTNDDFRDAASNGDSVLPYDDRVSKPERVDPPQIPAAVLNEAAMSAQDMKDVTGLHDASLGARSNETSGKAINARQREGDVATYIYHDNLHASIRAGGDVANQLIPVTYDTARTIVILGEDMVAKSKRVNDPTNPDAINFGNSKFDTVVDVGPSYSTKRQEASESMVAFFQALPGAAAVAGDLFAKAQDWPLAEEIAERLRRSMPPQLTAEEGAQPPQPDPAQVQAQQMAMQKAQLDLQEQQAKARKAEADAVKAEAEAAKAMAEASQMGVNVGAEAPMTGMARPAPTAPVEPPPALVAQEPAPMAPQPVPPTEAVPPAQDFEPGPISPDNLAPDQGFPAA